MKRLQGESRCRHDAFPDDPKLAGCWTCFDEAVERGEIESEDPLCVAPRDPVYDPRGAGWINIQVDEPRIECLTACEAADVRSFGSQTPERTEGSSCESWRVRNNRRLRDTTELRRTCRLEGCDVELDPARDQYCCDRHAGTARERRQRAATNSLGLPGPPRRSLGEELIADDARRRGQAIRRHAGRPILRDGIFDRDRIFDRVRPGEGRLSGEKRYGLPTQSLATITRGSGVALTARERAMLEGVVCPSCQRWATDCALLTDHQAVVARIVVLDDRTSVNVRRAA